MLIYENFLDFFLIFDPSYGQSIGLIFYFLVKLRSLDTLLAKTESLKKLSF